MQRSGEFYIDLATIFGQNAWLDLSFLYADNDAISAVFGFKYDGRFYYSNQTFSPTYSEYSPGSLHVLHLIQEAIEVGIKEFDFLKGAEAYKFLWTHLTRDNTQVIIARKNLGWWARSLPRVMRLIEISQRGLRRNYQLYLEKRRQEKAIAKINKNED